LSSEKGLCVLLARFDDSSLIGVMGERIALEDEVWRSSVGREVSMAELSEKGDCITPGVSAISVSSESRMLAEARRRLRWARE
jgi:hypothetical protein